MPRRSNRSVHLALLVLAAILVAELQIAFVHEDDGCAVEIHCLACRLTLGCGAVAASITSNVAPAGQAVAFVVPVTSIAASSTVLEAQRPRGPPSPTSQPISS
jgi:hypothetical protein